MKPILALLSLSCSAVFAASPLDDAAREVAATRTTQLQVAVFGKTVDLVFVGEADGCARVGASWSNKRIETLQICGTDVAFTGTVAPLFKATDQRLEAWGRQAMLAGDTTKRKEDGFLVESRLLPSVEPRCRSVEIVVSYDGEFVDRRVKRYC